MRFDLLPVTTHAWRQRGEPLRIPTPGKNVKLAVFGAYRWPDGPFVFNHGPKSVNTNVFVGTLPHLQARARRTGKLIILVLDNGSAHTSRRSRAELERLDDFLHVFWLPTYTSEQLNEIEWVWTHLKEEYFSRMLIPLREDFAQLREEFTRAVVDLLTPLRRAGMFRKVLKPRPHHPLHQNLAAVA